MTQPALATANARSAPAPGIPRRAWASMLLRAVPALIGAGIITFVPEHTPRFGLAVAGGVLLASGALVAFEAVGIRRHPTPMLAFARGVLTAIAGGTAIAIGAIQGDAASARDFIWLIAAWALATGALEVIAGVIARRAGVLGRDAMLTGAATLLVGLIVAIVPPELRADYGGLEHATGALTASTQAIGFVGAYFAILGVLLVIEGLSLRFAAREEPTA